MKQKTIAGVAVAALIVMVVGVWQGYEIGYRRGMRETLFRFLYLTDKAAAPSLAPQKSPIEEQAEQEVYSRVHHQFQRTVAKILLETGGLQPTPDDLAPMGRKE